MRSIERSQVSFSTVKQMRNVTRAAVATVALAFPGVAVAQSDECRPLSRHDLHDLQRHPESLTPALVRCLTPTQIRSLDNGVPDRLLACITSEVAGELVGATRDNWVNLPRRLSLDDLSAMTNEQVACFSADQLFTIMQTHTNVPGEFIGKLSVGQVANFSSDQVRTLLSSAQNLPADFLDKLTDHQLDPLRTDIALMRRVASARQEIVTSAIGDPSIAFTRAVRYFTDGRFMDAVVIYNALHVVAPTMHTLGFNILFALNNAVTNVNIAEARRDGNNLVFRSSVRSMQSGEAQLLASGNSLTANEYRFFISQIDIALGYPVVTGAPTGQVESPEARASRLAVEGRTVQFRTSLRQVKDQLVARYEAQVHQPTTNTDPVLVRHGVDNSSGRQGQRDPRVTSPATVLTTRSPLLIPSIVTAVGGGVATIAGGITYAISASTEIQNRDLCASGSSQCAPGPDGPWASAQATSRVGSTVAWIGVGAMVVGGAGMVYALTHPTRTTVASPASGASTVSVAVVPTSDGVSAGVSGSF